MLCPEGMCLTIMLLVCLALISVLSYKPSRGYIYSLKVCSVTSASELNTPKHLFEPPGQTSQDAKITKK